MTIPIVRERYENSRPVETTVRAKIYENIIILSKKDDACFAVSVLRLASLSFDRTRGKNKSATRLCVEALILMKAYGYFFSRWSVSPLHFSRLCAALIKTRGYASSKRNKNLTRAPRTRAVLHCKTHAIV